MLLVDVCVNCGHAVKTSAAVRLLNQDLSVDQCVCRKLFEDSYGDVRTNFGAESAPGALLQRGSLSR